MVKLQKTKRGTFIISIPKDVKNALGWEDAQKLNLCVNQQNDKLIVAPLRGV